MPPTWRDAIASKWCDDAGARHAVVDVHAGLTYRLRIINAGSGFTQRFSIDGHALLVVGVDGNEVRPIEVDEIWVYVAQRYDVIIRATGGSGTASGGGTGSGSGTATGNATGGYWIRGRTFREADGTFGEVVAALCYDAGTSGCAPTSHHTTPKRVLRDDSHLVPASGHAPPAFPTRRVEVELLCLRARWACFINGTAFEMPPRPALLTAFEGGDPAMGNPRTTHVRVAYGEVVDLVIDNVGTQEHPFHLHGNHFWVLGRGAGRFGPSHEGELNTRNPVKRDTVQVPQEGWMVLRFIANNPGVWVAHCHIR
jgi:iron transport multicopper oxidase